MENNALQITNPLLHLLGAGSWLAFWISGRWHKQQNKWMMTRCLQAAVVPPALSLPLPLPIPVPEGHKGGAAGVLARLWGLVTERQLDAQPLLVVCTPRHAGSMCGPLSRVRVAQRLLSLCTQRFYSTTYALHSLSAHQI